MNNSMNTVKRLSVLPAMLALISLAFTSCSTSRASCPSNQVALAGDRGATNELPICLVVDLVDGSRLVGVPGIASIPMQAAYAKLDIALKQVRSITLEPDREMAVFEMCNGDRVKGAMILKTLVLQTAFGKVSVGLEQISRVASTIYGSGIATGGTITNYTLDGINYQAHIFTNVGTTNFIVTGGALDCDVLIVAGGGGQGYYGGGGGGAGGLISTTMVVSVNSMSMVTVGAGGTHGSDAHTYGLSGGNSTFGSLTAYGGGGGGGSDGNTQPTAGGSGGGGSYFQTGAAGTNRQGFTGGNSTHNKAGAGGGGSASVGQNTQAYRTGGLGGWGTSSSISGEAKWYAAGCGGYAEIENPGTREHGEVANGTAAPANSGSGGYPGGSGIVIVRYVK